MDDPYEVLGVAKSASQADIQRAYRKSAKLHHPDLNPGKPAAEDRFKAISAANALLSDPEKRARFDRGEIDAAGSERPPERKFYHDFGDDSSRTKYRPDSGFDPGDLEDLFEQAFAGRARGDFALRGADARFALTIDFVEAANGAIRRVLLPDGRTLDVNIPAGIRDGQVLRLKGQGMPGSGSSSPGDALIAVSVAPHLLFRREGNDVIMELPVSLKEALLGTKVDVPTLMGTVKLTIPPNSANGARLRLKGRGIAGGSQHVVLKLVLPPRSDPALVAFLESWVPDEPFDPRAAMVRP